MLTFLIVKKNVVCQNKNEKHKERTKGHLVHQMDAQVGKFQLA